MHVYVVMYVAGSALLYAECCVGCIHGCTLSGLRNVLVATAVR